MTTDFEIIAAFVDGERVDGEALKQALASDDGRQYLVDLIALREVAGDDAIVPAPVSTGRTRRTAGWLAVAAGIALTTMAGYQAGVSRAQVGAAGTVAPASAARPQVTPPKPTVIIKLEPGTTWQDPTGGRP